MAVTIQKLVTKPTKTKKVEKLDPEAETISLEDISIEELANQYGDLNDKASAIQMSPVFTKLSLVAKELQRRVNAEYDPKDSISIQGTQYVVDVGACRKNPPEITDIKKVEKLLTSAVFIQLAKVNITDLRTYLNPAQLAQVLNEDTGHNPSRSLKAKFIGE